VEGLQPNAPTSFTSGVIPSTHWNDLRAHGSVGDTTKKIPSDTTGNRSPDRPTSCAAPYPLHYPRPQHIYICIYVFIYIAFKKSDLSSVRLLALLVRIPPGRVAVCLSSVLSDFAISHATAIIALTLVHGYYIDITKPDTRVLFRYQKARHTGTISISQSPTHGYYIDITNTESIITQICGAQDSVMLYVLFIYPGCGSYHKLVTKIQGSVTVHFPYRSISCYLTPLRE